MSHSMNLPTFMFESALTVLDICISTLNLWINLGKTDIVNIVFLSINMVCTFIYLGFFKVISAMFCSFLCRELAHLLLLLVLGILCF